MHNLGCLLESGAEVVELNVIQAVRLHKRAIDNGIIHTQ